MNTLTIDVKINNKVIKTINLDADVLLQEIDKPHYTKSEQTDIDRVKAISMTDWISIKSFIEENDIELIGIESSVLGYYINNEKISAKQARVLLILLDKVQNAGFTPEIPF